MPNEVFFCDVKTVDIMKLIQETIETSVQIYTFNKISGELDVFDKA